MDEGSLSRDGQQAGAAPRPMPTTTLREVILVRTFQGARAILWPGTVLGGSTRPKSMVMQKEWHEKASLVKLEV